MNGAQRPRPAARDRLGRLSMRAILAALILPFLLSFFAGAAVAEPREVRMGVFVTSLSGLDPSDGSFRVSGYAWLIDPSGEFDPEKNLEMLVRSGGFKMFAHQTLDDGSSYSAVNFDAVVNDTYDVRDYPFDRQTLDIVFESADPVSQLVFVPDRQDSLVEDTVRAPGWRVGGLSLRNTIQRYETGFGHRPKGQEFSRLIVTLDVTRKLSPMLFEKFTGFFVAFLISALVLLVPTAELGTRIGMTTGSVFAAVFNRYRLEDAIGFDAVFGLADQVSFLVFSAIMSILILSLLVHRLRVRRGPRLARALNFWLGGAILLGHAVLIAGAVLLALT